MENYIFHILTLHKNVASTLSALLCVTCVIKLYYQNRKELFARYFKTRVKRETRVPYSDVATV